MPEVVEGPEVQMVQAEQEDPGTIVVEGRKMVVVVVVQAATQLALQIMEKLALLLQEVQEGIAVLRAVALEEMGQQQHKPDQTEVEVEVETKAGE